MKRAIAVTAGLVAASLTLPAQAALPATPSPTPKPALPTTPSVATKDYVPKEAPVKAWPKAPEARTAWPATGKAEVLLSSARSTGKAGSLPITVAATGRKSPGKVQVELEPRNEDKLHFKVRSTSGAGTVRVTLDYSGFRDAYGGDWASRLRIRRADGGQIVAQGNNSSTGKLYADVPVDAAAQTFTVAADQAGAAGTYQATSLSPTGSWQVSNSSGAFTWSYPFRTPQVPGGLVPELAASYSSQAVDGRTAATNNQPSWVGDGWDLGAGFIERSYKSCAEDLGGNNAQRKTGDLCWETENATMSLGDKSSRLIFANGVWRPDTGDGTRVEHIVRTAGVNDDDNGEYWRITTAEGTQYYFGLNRLPGWTSGKTTTQSTWGVPVYGNDPGEPCNKATYETSACQQAYRWNLDYVVDRNGNAMSYYYDVEGNKYGQNLGATTATYTRGGSLRRIEYGLRDGDAYAQAPARVVLTTADRCVPGQNCAVHDGKAWPDVPWDGDCTTATCKDDLSPTFWSTKRLAKVNTQVSTGGGNYAHVDQWDLGQSYPSPGDNTAAGLWLDTITHTGLAGGTKATDPVRFAGEMKANRVDSAPDGLPALNRPRISTITTESGGRLAVKYAPTECVPGAPPAPDSNTKRCFPVRWTMPPEVNPRNDWFHKYVVAEVTEDDLLTDNYDGRTTYSYEGGAAWAYGENPLADPKYLTWSEWRGYEKVLVTKGDKAQEPTSPQSATRYHYFRGMHGDKVAAGGTKTVDLTDSTGTPTRDLEQYAGRIREQITYNGVGGAEVSGEIHDLWSRQTGQQDPYKAFQVEDVRTVTRKPITGGVRTTEMKSKYDDYGNVIEVNDLGDLAVNSDDRCTTTSYLPKTSTWLVSLPNHVRTVGVACGVTPAYPADAIEDTRTSYDDKGNAIGTQRAKSYSGSTPAYLTTSTTTYDSYGRTKEVKDALGRPTTTVYVETNGLTTGTTTTNGVGHTKSETIDPAVGKPVVQKDTNNKVTSLKYDPLGRLVAAWQPGRSEAAQESPHLQFEYGVRQSGGPNWVKTLALKANGNQVASYQLLDGFLRLRQTQEPSPLGGRILTDEFTNSRGLVFFKRAAYHDNSAAPGTTLATAAHGAVPNATVIGYDGAERPTADVHVEFGVDKWRTTTTYGGDRTTVLPPLGGTLSTTVTDARGLTTAKLQYQGRTTSSTAETTSYTYTKRGELATHTDPAGNVWRNEYDVLGRKVKTVDPDKGTSTMTYDDAGQLTSTTDARGKTVVNVYDPIGRPLETRLGSATGTLLTKAVYDTLAKGELSSSTRYSGGHAYVRQITGYDDAGRVTGEEVVIPAVEGALAGKYATTKSFADDGSPWSVGQPKLGDLAAESLNYSYDASGRPDRLTGAMTYISDTEYTALGEVAQLELGPDSKMLWQTSFYDPGTSRLKQVKMQRDAQGNVLATDQSYTYDQVGNVTRTTDLVQGRALDTQCFSYDHLRRTKAVWTATDGCAAAPDASRIGGPAPYWQEFSYDLTGNRTQVTTKGLAGAADKVSTYTYPAAGTARPHAVNTVTTGATAAAYQYDAAGNTVSRPSPSGAAQTLTWGDDGLLASVGSSSYVYDADGQVLIRRDAGSATLYVGSGEVTLTNGVLKGTRYYEGLGVRTGSGFSWTVADRHGTAQTALDAATLAISTRPLDAFGAPRGAATGWKGGDRGFVGGRPNADTGLTRLGAREYDATLGRFLSVDPVIDPTDPQQLNAYAYSNNSPATFTDPDGLRYFVDLDGYVTAPAAAGQTKQAMRRVDERMRRYKKMYNGWTMKQRKQREAKRDKFLKTMAERKKRGPVRMHKTVQPPRPISGLMNSVFGGDSVFKSGSFCSEIFAGVAVGGGIEGCVNVDAKGLTTSMGVKAGAVMGGEAAANLVLKANTGDATTLNNGVGYEASGSPRLGGWAKIMAELGSTHAHYGLGGGFDVTHDPTTGNSSVAIKGGVGLGASMGGYYNTVGVNSGYITEWGAVDDLLGDVTGLW